jgi:uncharacterized protein (DUF4415 family)
MARAATRRDCECVDQGLGDGLIVWPVGLESTSVASHGALFLSKGINLRKTSNQKQFVEGRGYSKEDWDAVDSPEMTDEELASLRPAREVLPKEFFEAVDARRRQRGRPPVEAPRKLISIRLDQDVIEKFKASGKGWQSRINETLRKASGL